MTKDYEGILNLKPIYNNVSSTNQFNTPSACFSRREISRTDFDKKQIQQYDSKIMEKYSNDLQYGLYIDKNSKDYDRIGGVGGTGWL